MTAMWNEARTGLLVPAGSGGLRFVEEGAEFEALAATALDFVPYTDPPPDMAALRADSLVQVIAVLAAAQAAITGMVTPAEMASWPSKASAARAWLADQTEPVPALIAGEATLRGKTPVQVATRIAQKADAWEVVIAAHTGLRGNAEEAIEAAATPEAIQAAMSALRAALT